MAVNQSTPQISVIMTAFNSERYISEAIQSILNQTYRDFEFIIVDDGSTDHTGEKITEFKDSRIRYFPLAHTGRASALNFAFRKVQSPYIAIMDSDDIAIPERLKTEHIFLAEHPSISIVGSWALLMDEKDKPIKILKKPIHHNAIINRLTANGFPSFGSVVFRKGLLSHKVLFNTSLTYAEDFEWYIRISEYVNMENIPIPLMKFRLRHRSLSRSNTHEKNKVIMDCIDTYFSTCKDDDPRPIKRLHGMAHYYYGTPNYAKSLLLDSLVKEGVTLLTLRYLIPLMLLGNKAFYKIRNWRAFQAAALLFRNWEMRR